MSLYHEAAEVLDKARQDGGSLKSIVFGRKSWKTDPKLLFALSAQTAKWSAVLSEVIERSDLLKHEKQVCDAQIQMCQSQHVQNMRYGRL